MKLLLGGVGFFVLMLALSSLFFIFGNNSISGENIRVEVSGPFSVGGGEELPLQVTIANDNAVPIESATLIVEYPPGTQSTEEKGREVFTDRIPLDSLRPGEVRNMSLKAVVFGEENDEKVIDVSVEYRVEGSNATFYKQAEPLRFKIGSSPVVLDVDTVRKTTSGQETTLKVTVKSNSPTPLTDVLVKAEYPFGFDYSTSDPAPVAGRDTWLFEELQPEEEKTITIKGVVTGGQGDDRVFNFSAGVSSERDQLALASVFSTGSAEMTVEAPFLGVAVTANNSSDETVAVGKGVPINVRVTLTNTQSDTVYDGEVDVQLKGNAVSNLDVKAQDGYYDSRSHVIRFDGGTKSDLKEIAPGRSVDAVFTLDPDNYTSSAPEIQLAVTVRGDRVFEDEVPQELVATAERTIRVEASAVLASAITNEGPFNNSGPVPPVADQTTEYTVQFEVRNGSNDATGAEATATLQPYVAWTDTTSGDGSFSYNGGTRTLTWNIGDMDGNETKVGSVQLAVTPSTSQIGRTPTVVDTQYFRATDRFTGTVIRTTSSALTTRTATDNGRVEASN